jgi:hypothetical protein
VLVFHTCNPSYSGGSFWVQTLVLPKKKKRSHWKLYGVSQLIMGLCPINSLQVENMLKMGLLQLTYGTHHNWATQYTVSPYDCVTHWDLWLAAPTQHLTTATTREKIKIQSTVSYECKSLSHCHKLKKILSWIIISGACARKSVFRDTWILEYIYIYIYSSTFKWARHWWLTPVILATCEGGIGRIMVQG